jgi:aryl-alcohol dehydrogenase-like predicted oxidoreductase
MGFSRTIPGTDLHVSAIGLGTVKLGRDQGVKYPDAFTIPDDAAVTRLLDQARDSGINLLDTAPAYGNSEQRLGKLLANRQDWIIATKTGEEFENGVSRFDFSASHTRKSIERSLKRLNTDYLDIVLIHSDGNDEAILQQGDCVQALQDLQNEGLVRTIGMSTKTIAGGIMAASLLDIVMIIYNLEQRDEAVLEYARENNKGILVKKGLMSGHAGSVEDSMQLLMQTPGIQSAIIGTITPDHLAENTRLAKQFA